MLKNGRQLVKICIKMSPSGLTFYSSFSCHNVVVAISVATSGKILLRPTTCAPVPNTTSVCSQGPSQLLLLPNCISVEMPMLGAAHFTNVMPKLLNFIHSVIYIIIFLNSENDSHKVDYLSWQSKTDYVSLIYL